MARVLVVGESWFVHSVHQKGFDSFFTSAYEEGGGAFLAALRERGHDVTYVPSHQIDGRLPTDVEGYAPYDVVVISDVGANSFQLANQTFTASSAVIPATDGARVVEGFTTKRSPIFCSSSSVNLTFAGAVVYLGGILIFAISSCNLLTLVSDLASFTARSSA